MRGRSTYPTGQEKKPVGATAVILFSTRKGWVPNRPLIRPSVRTGAPSPRGEGFGGGKDPSRLRNHLPQPAQPGGGPLRTLDYGPQARQKRRRTPAGSPQTRKGGSREEEPLPPWCSFLRLSPKKAGLPRRSRRGKPRRRAHPAPVQKAPNVAPAG